MSTVIAPSPTSAGNTPAIVVMIWRRRPFSSNSSAATQRVALPQAPGLAAVGIADAHEGVGPRGIGLDDDQLVAADAGAPVGDRRRPRRRQVEPPRPRVEHDEIVLQTMHLHERHQHPAYIGGSAGPLKRGVPVRAATPPLR